MGSWWKNAQATGFNAFALASTLLTGGGLKDYEEWRQQQDQKTTDDTGIDLVQDFTDDVGLLNSAIHQIRPGGGTKMLDAIYLSCEEKLKTEQGRKVLIVISDGDDNLSIRTLASTLEMAQKPMMTIFSLMRSTAFHPV
jgi:hypothetical protein